MATDAPHAPRIEPQPPDVVDEATGAGAPPTLAPSSVSTSPRPHTPSLADRTAAGAGFMAVQVVLTRVIGFACNLAITALLAPEHFGLFAKASTVVAIASLVMQFGLREVLIRKQSSFRHLANAGFWMGVLAGILCAGAMVGLTPLAVKFYNAPGLAGLLWIMAVSIPIGTLSIVPEAKLSIDLRFKWLSSLNSVVAIGSGLLTLLFAWLHFEAYALVLPRLVTGIIRSAIAFHVSGFRPRFNIQFRRWRFFLGDSSWAFVSCVAMMVVMQADVAILGRTVSGEALGLYSWSLTLSLQMMVLLAMSLGQVLMPALAKLSNEPARQADAAIRACRMLGMLVVPTFLLQAAAMEPLILLLFKPHWHDTIPILQILSIGMAGRFFGQPTGSLFQSQGRFRTWAFIIIGLALTLILAICIGLWLSVPPGTTLFPLSDAASRPVIFAVACALSAWGVIVEPIGFYLAIRPAGRGMMDVLPILLRPLVIGAISVSIGVYAMSFVPRGSFDPRIYHILRLMVLGAVSCPLILLGTRLLMRPVLDDLLDRLGPMLSAVGIRRRSRLSSP